MEQSLLGTNTIVQVAILVNHIEKTAKEFADFLGLPMPAIEQTAGYEQTQAQYHGSPCYATSKLAFLPLGGAVMLEIIEPDQTPSVWRDALNQNGEGFHHLAFVVDGMKEKTMIMENAGMPLTMRGEYNGGRYAYFDCADKLKMALELLEND